MKRAHSKTVLAGYVDLNNFNLEGGRPGLLVMGDYSYSRSPGFESRHCKLHGHDIFHIDLL